MSLISPWDRGSVPSVTHWVAPFRPDRSSKPPVSTGNDRQERFVFNFSPLVWGGICSKNLPARSDLLDPPPSSAIAPRLSRRNWRPHHSTLFPQRGLGDDARWIANDLSAVAHRSGPLDPACGSSRAGGPETPAEAAFSIRIERGRVPRTEGHYSRPGVAASAVRRRALVGGHGCRDRLTCDTDWPTEPMIIRRSA